MGPRPHTDRDGAGGLRRIGPSDTGSPGKVDSEVSSRTWFQAVNEPTEVPDSAPAGLQ